MKTVSQQEVIAAIVGALSAYKIVPDAGLPKWDGGYLSTFIRYREMTKQSIKEAANCSFFQFKGVGI